MRTVLGSIVMVAVAVTALLGQAAQSADPVTVLDVASVKSVGAADDSFSIDFFPGGRFVTGGLALLVLMGLANHIRTDLRIVWCRCWTRTTHGCRRGTPWRLRGGSGVPATSCTGRNATVATRVSPCAFQ